MSTAPRSGPQTESMTGYGEHRAKLAGTTYVCRARSLNHRFLDLKVRLPRADLMSLDLAVRKSLSAYFKRGAIELTLTAETDRESCAVALNATAAEKFAKQAQKIGKKLKLKNTSLTLDGLLRLPGVVAASGSTHEEPLATAATDEVLAQLIEPALEALKKTRQAEGRKLTQMLLGHLGEMDAQVEAIAKLEAPEKEKARALMITRATETLKLLASASGAAAPSPSEEFAARLREEAVFWIERRDFDEERNRLAMHLAELRRLLCSPTEPSAGRKLEFIQQEVLREINTLGTKAQSPKITSHTIELKTILERVREQLANVE